jgi:hypothetical protein
MKKLIITSLLTIFHFSQSCFSMGGNLFDVEQQEILQKNISKELIIYKQPLVDFKPVQIQTWELWPVFYVDILSLVSSFLLPKDYQSALTTCKAWNQTLSKEWIFKEWIKNIKKSSEENFKEWFQLTPLLEGIEDHLKFIRAYDEVMDRYKSFKKDFGDVDSLNKLQAVYRKHKPFFDTLSQIKSEIKAYPEEYKDLENYIFAMNLTRSLEENVTQLELANMDFKIIPISIRFMKNVKEIDLYNNYLSEIPDWLSELPLEKISFIDNPLVSLPNALLMSSTLKEIQIDKGLSFLNSRKDLKIEEWEQY